MAEESVDHESRADAAEAQLAIYAHVIAATYGEQEDLTAWIDENMQWNRDGTPRRFTPPETEEATSAEEEQAEATEEAPKPAAKKPSVPSSVKTPGRANGKVPDKQPIDLRAVANGKEDSVFFEAAAEAILS